MTQNSHPTPAPRRWKDATPADLHELRVVQGRLIDEIATLYGTTPEAVSSYCRKHRILLPKRRIQERQRAAAKRAVTARRKNAHHPDKPVPLPPPVTEAAKAASREICAHPPAVARPKITGTDVIELARRAMAEGYPVTTCDHAYCAEPWGAGFAKGRARTGG